MTPTVLKFAFEFSFSRFTKTLCINHNSFQDVEWRLIQVLCGTKNSEEFWSFIICRVPHTIYYQLVVVPTFHDIFFFIHTYKKNVSNFVYKYPPHLKEPE